MLGVQHDLESKQSFPELRNWEGGSLSKAHTENVGNLDPQHQ